MLWAALALFLVLHFSHHSPAVMAPFEQAAALIKKDVADPAHQKQALAIVDQMRAEAKVFSEKRDRSMDALTKLLVKRATPTSDIEHAGEPLIDEDRAYAEKILDLRVRLKSVLSASEWAKVFPTPAVGRTSANTATARGALGARV